MTESALDVPVAEDVEGVRELRAVLDRQGYTADAVEGLLSKKRHPFSRSSRDLPYQLRLLPEGEPLSTLIRLLLLGLSVPREAAADALAPLALDRLQAMGVLRIDGERVEPLVDIVPTEELLVCSDRFHPDLPPERRDEVLGLTPPTRVLACLTARRKVGSTLDLGCGSGVQAILAAAHSGHVVGVDLNGRALRFAAFNAALNGVENVEWREGNMFDPVEGERFDLIVCNPPYVISPDTEFIYRDSGLPGDSFCEGIVRRVPEFLEEDGLAHVLVAWGHDEDGEWWDPLLKWLEGSGCDALLLCYVRQTPLEHAAQWNELLRGDDEAYAAALDRWTAYCERLGIERIGWGELVLRRREGANWVAAFTPPADRMEPSGHHLERLLAAQDLLHGADLRDVPLAPAPDHSMTQTVGLGGGQGQLARALLRLDDGLHFDVVVEPSILQILLRLDGRRPLGAVLAETVTAAPPEIDRETWVEGALPGIARLVELGFLVPTGEFVA